MGEDIFLTSAPFLFVLMSLYILFELIRINAFVGGAWELNSLMCIPILFVLMSLYILFELIRINAFVGGAWELNSLMCIPIIFIIVYSYIGVYDPPIELARNILRIGVSMSLGIACYIAYAYSKMIRRGRK